MARRLRASDRRDRAQSIQAYAGISLVVVVLAAMFGAYFYAASSNPELDPQTMCPVEATRITNLTVLLVDVTDPMNLPQRQDFINQLHNLAEGIPRFGKLIVTKVDPISEQLLAPVIIVCNPGTAEDASQWSGNPKKLAELYSEKFRKPLDRAFESLASVSGADRSPILESIQSVNLTEFQKATRSNLPKLLVVASDLLQHTDSISFYKGIPDADRLISSPEFGRTRTDLRGVEVELWMLERIDNRKTQPRTLAELWDALIQSQNGSVKRLYRISG